MARCNNVYFSKPAYFVFLYDEMISQVKSRYDKIDNLLDKYVFVL